MPTSYTTSWDLTADYGGSWEHLPVDLGAPSRALMSIAP